MWCQYLLCLIQGQENNTIINKQGPSLEITHTFGTGRKPTELITGYALTLETQRTFYVGFLKKK